MMRFFFPGLLFLLLHCFLIAQECTPSPGASLLLEDFGSGSGAGAALASGTTTYSFGGIDEGMYLISNTSNRNGNFWHDGLDHTEGDINGYMLLVNADEGAGIFYQKMVEVCPNTDYIFSSYIANVVVPIGCIYTEPGVYQDAIPVPNSCNDTLITTTLTGITRLLPTYATPSAREKYWRLMIANLRPAPALWTP